MPSESVHTPQKYERGETCIFILSVENIHGVENIPGILVMEIHLLNHLCLMPMKNHENIPYKS